METFRRSLIQKKFISQVPVCVTVAYFVEIPSLTYYDFVYTGSGLEGFILHFNVCCCGIWNSIPTLNCFVSFKTSNSFKPKAK